MNARIYLLPAAALIAICSFFSSMSSADVSVKHAGMKISLPGQPMKESVDIGSGMMQQRLIINRPNGTIVIWYQDAPKKLGDPGPFLRNAQQTIEKMAGGTLLSEKEFEIDGHPIRMFTVTIPGKKGEFRVAYLYASGKYYQVMTVGTTDFTRSAEVNRLFRSIEFVD